MDVGTISIVLIIGLIFMLAIGMPLGFASAVLAALVMIMKFEPTLFTCLLYTSPSPRDGLLSRMPSSA